MTYFGVLLRFIGPPLVILIAVTLYDLWRGRHVPAHFRTWSPWAILFGHVLIALIYTTPWDNYLVANRVWWYDPDLVTGIVFGWVPIEEYTFFIVQTLLSGLWLLFLVRRQKKPARPMRSNATLRWVTGVAAGLVWLLFLILFITGWEKGLYLSLLLAWILPPIILQLGFGADILWRYRQLILLGFLPPFLYLCLVDGLAIASGTWTINPDKTLGLDLFGVLPLEEITFFLVTNVVIAFGITLMLANESHMRAKLPTANKQL